MNKKFILILMLVGLLIVSVSFTTAQDDNDTLTQIEDNTANADKLTQNDNNDDLTAPDNTDDLVGDEGDAGGNNNGITVKKVWNDNDDAYGNRPTEITFTASINGDDLGEFKITAEDDWQITIDEQATQDTEITIKEQTVSGYTSEVTGSAQEGFVITNTIVEEEYEEPTDDNSDNYNETPEAPDEASDETPDDDTDDNTDDNTDDSAAPTTGNDDATNEDTSDNGGNNTTTVTKTITKHDKKPAVKDKHKTGYPILLGILAISAGGLAIHLRRRE